MFEYIMIMTLLTGPQAGEGKIVNFHLNEEHCELSKPQTRELYEKLTRQRFELECWKPGPRDERLVQLEAEAVESAVKAFLDGFFAEDVKQRERAKDRDREELDELLEKWRSR